MAKTYQYCVAENWGKGFINHDEAWRITFKSFPGNVWQVPANNKHANLWIAKVAGVVKTKDEAQTIVSGVITTSQNVWDADTVDGETEEQAVLRKGNRPVDIVLPE